MESSDERGHIGGDIQVIGDGQPIQDVASYTKEIFRVRNEGNAAIPFHFRAVGLQGNITAEPIGSTTGIPRMKSLQYRTVEDSRIAMHPQPNMRTTIHWIRVANEEPLINEGFKANQELW